MAFSKYLDSKRADCKALVAQLKKHFAYVSILGVDIKTTGIRVDRNTSNIGPGQDTECGFVVKMHNGTVFCEYSLDDIGGDIPALAEKIAAGVAHDHSNTIAQSTLPQLASAPNIAAFKRLEHITLFATVLAVFSSLAPVTLHSRSFVAPSPSPAISLQR